MLNQKDYSRRSDNKHYVYMFDWIVACLFWSVAIYQQVLSVSQFRPIWSVTPASCIHHTKKTSFALLASNKHHLSSFSLSHTHTDRHTQAHRNTNSLLPSNGVGLPRCQVPTCIQSRRQSPSDTVTTMVESIQDRTSNGSNGLMAIVDPDDSFVQSAGTRGDEALSGIYHDLSDMESQASEEDRFWPASLRSIQRKAL